MSRNIIEISSEDDSIGVSNPKPGIIHTLSSSSDSEVEYSSLASKEVSTSKAYKIPKISSNYVVKSTSPLSYMEDFPSPSKLDAFQSSSKYKKNLKRSPRCDKVNKSGEFSPKASKNKHMSYDKNPNSEDESQNLNNSTSSIKSHDVSDSNSDSSISLPSVNKVSLYLNIFSNLGLTLGAANFYVRITY